MRSAHHSVRAAGMAHGPAADPCCSRSRTALGVSRKKKPATGTAPRKAANAIVTKAVEGLRPPLLFAPQPIAPSNGQGLLELGKVFAAGGSVDERRPVLDPLAQVSGLEQGLYFENTREARLLFFRQPRIGNTCSA